ncbi:MAG: hypothetical protein FJZ16_06985 [Candidatus Omnitrophica bacterium]|nr:hypothetical protein [Candidatus Omnitrophota bacterium]
MRQERKGYSERDGKFEEGVLRADACFDRHSQPRRYQYRTYQEDLPSYSFGMSAVREERRLMRKVYQLISLDLKPQGSETLEEFVQRNSDSLEEEVF